MMKQSPQDAHSIQSPLTGVNTARKPICTLYFQAALIEQLQKTTTAL